MGPSLLDRSLTITSKILLIYSISSGGSLVVGGGCFQLNFNKICTLYALVVLLLIKLFCTFSCATCVACVKVWRYRK